MSVASPAIRFGRSARALAALALAGATAACASSPDGTIAYRQSAEIATVYGLFRVERAPPDAPYDSAALTRHFERVAFDQEDQKVEIDPKAIGETYTLSRWEVPIRYEFIGDDVRDEDRRVVAQIFDRIAGATGVDVAEAAGETAGNFQIVILSPAARSDWWDGMSNERREGLSNTAIEAWVKTLAVPCAGRIGYGVDGGRDGGRIERGLILIKAELEGVFRESCFEEEIAQSMGLLNDHDDVRPSIFNDKNEFAVMTRHDADLMRILYDARLAPGMTRDQAMPLVREIAAGLGSGADGES